MDEPGRMVADPAPPPPPARRRWWMAALRWAGGILLSLLLILVLAVWGLDTAPGHRFVADRIGALPIRSGLRIRIGRIDGSLWGRLVLRDFRLYDPRGLFLEAPEVDLDWHPLAWSRNRLEVDRLQSDLTLLYRAPRLRPPRANSPLLPGFDIHLGKLRLARLRLGPSLAGGRVRTARIAGRIEIRDRRALINLSANVEGGGDALRLLLDAAPDADRFDLDAHLRASAGSVTGHLLGLRQPLRLDVDGKGTWAAWRGSARLALADRPAGTLALVARRGRYALSGTLRPAPFLTGKLQRLTSPALRVAGSAGFADRRLAGRLALDSAALGLVATGTLDLAESSFRRVAIRADLKQPAALFPSMTGRNIRLDLGLDGPFRTAAFAYRLTAPRFAFDTTGFEDAHAEGRGRLSTSPVAVPIAFFAKRVTGVGDVAGGILADLSLGGTLEVTAKALTGSGLTLGSDKLKGKLALFVDLVTGSYTVDLSGGLTRYLIPGLGIVDVVTLLKVVPDPSGHGTRVAGRGRVWVRRFDNAFLSGLAGGLPSIDTGLVRGGDGVLHLVGLKLTAPALTIAGNGIRRRDGTFMFSGSGAQATYGPLRLALDGDIARPKIDLVLAHPADALGLADVTLALNPDPAGFAYEAAGGSTLGPFRSAGRIALPKDLPATILVAALQVSGTRAGGSLVSRASGFEGRLDAAGGGLAGPLLFSVAGGHQRIETHLVATGATIAGPAALAVRRGKLDAVALLDPAGTSIEATVQAQGLRRGSVSIARLAGNVSLRGGRGTIKASVAGSRGRAFDLRVEGQVAPDRFALAGEGTVDGNPLKLTAPAVLVHDGAGWRLAPTGVRFAGGTSSVSGRFGGAAGTQVDATLERMPLSVLDIARPDLGLGGAASGTFAYRLAPGATRPTGRADLRIRGLSRAGLVLSSRPIDVGLAGVLDGRGLAARAIMASGGQTIGRAQARIAPLGADGDLTRAPLFAQLRYQGPADTLWRLTGVEIVDLSGPIAIGADLGGTLAAPAIRGSVKAQGARLESPVTGTVLQNVQTVGRFDGAKLVLDSFSGSAAKGAGSVTGRGSFDFGAAGGVGLDLALQADHAPLLARDELGATVTGPLTIRSTGRGGTIAGDVKLEASRFRLGRAAAAAIPRLNAREINLSADEPEAAAPSAPWRMAIHAVAPNRLLVTGLGLDSEWRADLHIGGSVENPSLTGRADLRRGTYEFSGRRFDLDHGAITFQGETPPDPVLDIVAQANITGLSATIRVGGTGLKPDISFQSVPALPEDELLARLLFGSSITNLSAPEALQLAAAVNALRTGGGGGLVDPINAVRRVAGLDRLRILPADVTTGQGTSVAAGKYIGRRTYVEVVTDGQGYSATNLEFRVTRWLSLLSTISTIGRQSANVRVSKDY